LNCIRPGVSIGTSHKITKRQTHRTIYKIEIHNKYEEVKCNKNGKHSASQLYMHNEEDGGQAYTQTV